MESVLILIGLYAAIAALVFWTVAQVGRGILKNKR